jgi:mono/diheme cytochrome c family protein
MTRRWAWVALALPLLGACRQTPQMPGMGIQTGQQIYLARCAVCHGPDREGLLKYPALAGSQWVDGPPNRLAAIILDGIQGRIGNYAAVMPGWGATLRDTEIAAVMTWLRKQDGKGPVTAVDVNHMRIVTAGRGAFWTEEDLRHLPDR